MKLRIKTKSILRLTYILNLDNVGFTHKFLEDLCFISYYCQCLFMQTTFIYHFYG